MRIMFVTAVAAIAAAVPASAKDPNWQVRRSVSSGSCSLQRADTLPTLGDLLATRPTKKTACQAAKGLKTEDAGNNKKCFDYTPNTERLCSAEGVDLPK